jgi:hypothetical protein
MGIFALLKDFLTRIFSSDPEESRRRAELKKVYQALAEMKPPYFRPKQNLVLPGFAHAVHQFCTTLKPLAELARATVANSDIRVSQRYFDFLIDSRLSPYEQERKRFFVYDGMVERIQQAVRPEEEIDSISREFQDFLRAIEDLGSRAVNADLYEVDRFIDLCRNDYERILGLFDPSASLDDPRYKPDFSAVQADQLLPELADFYYLTEGFVFGSELKENMVRLLERRNPGSATDAVKRAKIDKLFSQLDKILADRLGKEILLSLMRAARAEPYYTPDTPRERRDFLESYRRRIMVQFEKDRERILREQHENVITADIHGLFGDGEILTIEGYDEENDSYLRRESPNGFAWIKPMRILKTFIVDTFEPLLRESIKRILVEGYFDNKNYQNNLANVLFQCERSLARISEFEQQLKGNGRVSIVTMKRYIEEMRRGKDIGAFLTRLVDAINGRAREVVEDETGLFSMLSDALNDLTADYRRPSPELITNLRTLGAGRNREIMAQVQAGRDRIVILIKIMRNFTFVKVPGPDALAAREPSEEVEPDIPEPERLEDLDGPEEENT